MCALALQISTQLESPITDKNVKVNSLDPEGSIKVAFEVQFPPKVSGLPVVQALQDGGIVLKVGKLQTSWKDMGELELITPASE